MMKLLLFMAVLSFSFSAGKAQFSDSLFRSSDKMKLSDKLNDMLRFDDGALNYNYLLKNPMENKNISENKEKILLAKNDEIQGVITPSPLDNMPVLRPMGNFPNRDYFPDPTHRYPMPILRPERLQMPVEP